jgi:hypothetical protein
MRGGKMEKMERKIFGSYQVCFTSEFNRLEEIQAMKQEGLPNERTFPQRREVSFLKSQRLRPHWGSPNRRRRK